MKQHQAPHAGGPHHDVGDLRRHADDEGEIEEIPRAGLLGAGKIEAARFPRIVVIGVRIKQMGIPERHDRVQHQPAERHAGDGQQ